MTTPPDPSAAAAPRTRAEADAAPLRFPPDRADAEAAIALVHSALAGGAFLGADDAGVFEAAVERYRRLGLTGLLESLLDRVGALCALNEGFGQEFARHRGRISLTESPSPYITAGTARYDDGSSLILFDSGLFHTLWEVAQIVCGALPVREGAGPTVPLDEAQAILALHRASHRILGGSRFGTQFVLTPQAGQAAALLVDGAQLFVLAHEVAHILLGHRRTPAGSPVALPQAELVESTDAAELAADIVAFHVATEDLRADGSAPTFSEVLFRVAGARLVFACIDLVERENYVVAARSHPPARRRWEVVRAYAVESFGAAMADRIDDLWLPFETMTAELDRSLPSVHTLVESYGRLVARHGLLAAPLTADALRSLLVRARCSNLDGDEVQRLTVGPVQDGVLAAIRAALPTWSTAAGLTWRQLHTAVSTALSSRSTGNFDDGDRWVLTAVIARELRAGRHLLD